MVPIGRCTKASRLCGWMSQAEIALTNCASLLEPASRVGAPTSETSAALPFVVLMSLVLHDTFNPLHSFGVLLSESLISEVPFRAVV